MITSTDFLLERVTHQVLGAMPRQAHELLTDARKAGMPAAALIAEVLFPVIECLQQLKQDRALAARAANAAARTLSHLLHHLADEAPRASETQRAALVLAAPGHTDELGASALSVLAEIQGFSVMFAGANLSIEEIAFATGQLQPDLLLMHAGIPAWREQTRALVRRCQYIGLWPRVQIVLAGAVVHENDSLGADIASQEPMAALELSLLCPEHRAPRQPLPVHDGYLLNRLCLYHRN